MSGFVRRVYGIQPFERKLEMLWNRIVVNAWVYGRNSDEHIDAINLFRAYAQASKKRVYTYRGAVGYCKLADTLLARL